MSKVNLTTQNEPIETPTAGTTEIYVDLATKKLASKNDVGVVTDYGATVADEKTKITANDTTSGLLDAKVTVGSGLTKSIANPSANEQLNITVDPSNIDHDSLQNFVTEEHVDWSAASAGTIHSTNLNPATIDHDSLQNFVAAEHVDWSGAGAGTIHTDNYVENATHTGEVTGSGALTVDKIAISNKSAVSAALNDNLLLGDVSDTDNLKKATVQSIVDLTDVNWHPTNTNWKLFWNDFTGVAPPSALNYAIGDGTLGLMAFRAGTSNSWVTAIAAEADRFGLHDIGLGTSAGALSGVETSGEESSLRYGDARIKLGAAVRLPDVPSGTEDFTFWIGLGDNVHTFSGLGNAWYLEYGVNSTNWICRSDGTALDNFDSGVAFGTSWINLEIDIAADLSSVKFYADGVLKHTETDSTNIPVAGTEVSFNITSRATSVTKVNHFFLDWTYIAIKPENARGSIAPWIS